MKLLSKLGFLAPIVPAVFGTSALFCSILGSFLCKFVSIDELNTGKAVNTGIWLKQQIYLIDSTDTGGGWSTFKGCGSYPDGLDYDANWKTAMAFSIISVVLGAACCFALYFAACMVISDPVWKLFGFLLVLNTLFQGLTFLFLASNACSDDRTFWNSNSLVLDLDGGCQMASGGNLSIAACVLWFISGICTLAISNPSNEGLSALTEEKVDEPDDKAAEDDEEKK